VTRPARRRLALLLAGLCLATALLAASRLLPPPAPSSPAADAGAATEPPAPPPLAPLAAFPETTARPLFLAARASLPGGPAPAAPARSDLVLGRYAFVGAVAAPGRSLVLLAPAAGGPVLRVREGDELDGWQVLEIGTDFLRISRGEETVAVPLVKPERR
jgi:hypothetical protein